MGNGDDVANRTVDVNIGDGTGKRWFEAADLNPERIAGHTPVGANPVAAGQSLLREPVVQPRFGRVRGNSPENRPADTNADKGDDR